MKVIAKWMKDQGLTQSEFARLLGVDRHQVNRWLRGKKRPNLDTLRRLQKATGLSLDDLTKGL